MLALLPLLVQLLLAEAVSNSGPVGPIDFYSLGLCDSELNEINFKVALNNEGDDSHSLAMSFDIPEDWDDVTFTVEADEWKNNAWQTNMYTKDETELFDFLNKNVGKLYSDFRKKVEPKIDVNDKFPKGNYKIEKFQGSWKDVDADSILYGRYKVRITILSNGEEKVCFAAEAETREQ